MPVYRAGKVPSAVEGLGMALKLVKKLNGLEGYDVMCPRDSHR